MRAIGTIVAIAAILVALAYLVVGLCLAVRWARLYKTNRQRVKLEMRVVRHNWYHLWRVLQLTFFLKPLPPVVGDPSPALARELEWIDVLADGGSEAAAHVLNRHAAEDLCQLLPKLEMPLRGRLDGFMAEVRFIAPNFGVLVLRKTWLGIPIGGSVCRIVANIETGDSIGGDEPYTGKNASDTHTDALRQGPLYRKVMAQNPDSTPLAVLFLFLDTLLRRALGVR